jgi:23S rRNA C2498 (ribose-2'-O)-methylase RlmM
MRNEVKTMAKTCRTFQLKLKKAQEKSGKLKVQNAELAQSVHKSLKRKHQVPHQLQHQAQGNELWKSAAIWAAVLVAGYQLLKSRIAQ